MFFTSNGQKFPLLEGRSGEVLNFRLILQRITELGVWRDTEKAMAPHSSTLAQKIPWTEEPGRMQSMGLRRVGHDWVISLSLFTFMHWRRNGNPLQCSCLENPRDREPGRLPSMGSHRVGHNWSNLAAAVVRILLNIAMEMITMKCILTRNA